MEMIQSIATMAMSYVAAYVLVGLVVFAATWAFVGFVWLYIGRKAGLDKDWMPFVPIANTLYRLRIVDEQWWKLFFFEGYVIYGAILFVIINAISNGAWVLFGVILVAIYWVACIAYTVYWRYKYYTAFGIQPHMALTVLAKVFDFVSVVIDCLNAFTNLFEYGGTASTVSLTGLGKGVGKSMGIDPKAGSLTGLTGMYAGQKIPMAPGEELLIGRDSSSNLIIDSGADKLSRKHCGITFDAGSGTYRVIDYSSNGTYIDGGNRLVANMATTLQRGTVLALGNRENRFKLD